MFYNTFKFLYHEINIFRSRIPLKQLSTLAARPWV